ncbi:MAG TPA: hypothetical protein P5548_02895 [Candidatus Moranbacteria bacterium]|nr:hypothetical protein [Candidatus Moranbacteria bacterium]HRZ33816.1 hypothetical protein [Candidatus Moranbacteria bacterium]
MKKTFLALVAIAVVVGFVPMGQAVTINGERQVIAGPQYEAPPPPEAEVSPADFRKLKTEVTNLKKSTNSQFARINGELEAQKEVSNDIEAKVDGQLKDLSVKIDRHEGWLSNLTGAYNTTAGTVIKQGRSINKIAGKLVDLFYFVLAMIGAFIIIAFFIGRRK